MSQFVRVGLTCRACVCVHLSGLQRSLQLNPPHARAHGSQALRVQGLREGVPAGQHAVQAQDHPHPGMAIRFTPDWLVESGP